MQTIPLSSRPTPGFFIHHADTSEASIIAALISAAYADSPNQAHKAKTSYQDVEAMLDRGADIFLAVQGTSVPFGCLVVEYQGDAPPKSAEIHTLAVIPTEQGKGAGSQLLCHAIDFCKEKGAEKIQEIKINCATALVDWVQRQEPGFKEEENTEAAKTNLVRLFLTACG